MRCGQRTFTNSDAAKFPRHLANFPCQTEFDTSFGIDISNQFIV
jgi:hypothetical protein